MKKISIFAILCNLYLVAIPAMAVTSYTDFFTIEEESLMCTRKYAWSANFVIQWKIGNGSFKMIPYEHRSNFTSVSEYDSLSDCQKRLRDISSSAPMLLEYEVDLHYLKPTCIDESVQIFFLENFVSYRKVMNDCAAH